MPKGFRELSRNPVLHYLQERDGAMGHFLAVAIDPPYAAIRIKDKLEAFNNASGADRLEVKESYTDTENGREVFVLSRQPTQVEFTLLVSHLTTG